MADPDELKVLHEWLRRKRYRQVQLFRWERDTPKGTFKYETGAYITSKFILDTDWSKPCPFSWRLIATGFTSELIITPDDRLKGMERA